MPDPYFGRSSRPKAATLANQAGDTRVLSELRRPAAAPMFCRHRHVFANCRICVAERDALMGRVARRL